MLAIIEVVTREVVVLLGLDCDMAEWFSSL